jgi:hypothetical protein
MLLEKEEVVLLRELESASAAAQAATSERTSGIDRYPPRASPSHNLR